MLGSEASENLLFEVVKPITRVDTVLGIYLFYLVDVLSHAALIAFVESRHSAVWYFAIVQQRCVYEMLELLSENENNNLVISHTVLTGVYVTLL